MDGASMSFGWFSILPLLLGFLYIGLFGVSVYCLILFIKLARRGIKVMDIYLSEKQNNR